MTIIKKDKKIALPITDTKLSSHFGNCSDFQIYSIENNTVVTAAKISLPLHQPDSIPIWLAEMGISDVITAGIGLKDIKILTRHKINVFAGVEAKDTKVLVKEFLDGVLETNGSLYDHN